MYTQKKAILEWLQAGRTITPMDALKEFGCFRLSAQIFNLKKEGYNISKEMVERPGGKRFAKYKLEA